MQTYKYLIYLILILAFIPITSYCQDELELEAISESIIKFSNPSNSDNFQILSSPGATDKEMQIRYNNSSILHIQGDEKRIGIKKDFPLTDLHIQQPTHSKDLTDSSFNNEKSDAGITLDGIIYEYDEEYGDYSYPSWRIYVDINRNLAFEYKGIKRGYLQYNTNVGPIYATDQNASETKSFGDQEMMDLVLSLQKEIEGLKTRIEELEGR